MKNYAYFQIISLYNIQLALNRPISTEIINLYKQPQFI